MAATHVALLRGINVGGRTRLPMTALRTVAANMGLGDVSTLLNSGNLLFSGGGPGLADALQERLAAEIGFAPPVVIRPLETLATLAGAARQAFPDAESSRVVGIFLSAPSPVDPQAAFAGYPEDVRRAGDDLIANYVNGQAGSKLGAARLEKILGVATATARNINTIEKLAGYRR